MKRKRVDSIWMSISIIFFLFLSVSFLLIPLGSDTSNGYISVYTLVAGLMFWISLIMGIVAQCVLAYRRKMWYAVHRARRVRSGQKIGVFSFFRNPLATVADIALIISIIGLIITIVLKSESSYICYVLISALVFSFSMHCILNGKNFHHIISDYK